jgi:uncharacterized protein
MQTNPGLSKEFNEITIQLRAEYSPRIADLAGEIARVYGQRFTEQELKDVLAFFKTSAGRKYLGEKPRLLDETSWRVCSNGSPGLPRTS